ncbi:hypothetical protein MACH08_38000 [Oceanobacillus kimchii]|uniref:TetR/AcrR family transcriptional regulator n=3 Tax=Oceanobacillus TaxID=182709 RepID=A0ABQ5TMH0_9BACI|nr:hypothetical protein MACH08_38000 [Oceanobacillus kimchii]
MFHEVYKDFIETLSITAKQIMDKDLPFEETLLAMSQNKIHFLHQINNQFYLDIMEHLTKKDDDGLSLMINKFAENSYGMLLDLFHRGRKEGKVDLKYSDEFLLLYFQAIVEGISNPKIYERIVPYTEEWTELLIKGLAPNKSE